jgi:hypothetical protein
MWFVVWTVEHCARAHPACAMCHISAVVGTLQGVSASSQCKIMSFLHNQTGSYNRVCVPKPSSTSYDTSMVFLTTPHETWLLFWNLYRYLKLACTISQSIAQHCVSTHSLIAQHCVSTHNLIAQPCVSTHNLIAQHCVSTHNLYVASLLCAVSLNATSKSSSLM